MAFVVSHSSTKKRSMNGAQFHSPRVGNAGERLLPGSRCLRPFARLQNSSIADRLRSLSELPPVTARWVAVWLAIL